MNTQIGLALSTLVVTLLLNGCNESKTPDQQRSEAAQDAKPIATDVTKAEFATGANIAGANGMHFGPDGLLYIASVNGSEIIVMDPQTGAVRKRLTAADGVTGPDDVAFAPDGSYYWTSIMTGEVAGITKDGKRVTAALLTPGVNPLTFSDDGRLFVSQCFLDDKLYEVDPSGKTDPRLISDQLGPHCGLNGMDWGPDGRLYGPRWYQNEVVSFDVDANTMRTEASGFMTPAAVKFDSKGQLHVLDTGKGQVIRVEKDGTQTIVAQLDPGLDNFAFDSKDQIFVSSFTDGYVKRVEADGSLTTLSPGGMVTPAGLTILGDDVIVADVSAIRGFNMQTGESTLVERTVIGMSDMGGAINVSADGDNLLLTSWWDGGVRLWSPTERKVLERYPDLELPVSAVRYAGKIVVAEHGKNRVVSVGKYPIVYASELSAPTGLVAALGNLYLSDRSTGQILLIAEQGSPLETPRIIVSDLTTPEGFVVTDSGFVVVEADAGRITLIEGQGQRSILAEFPVSPAHAGPGQPPSMIFDGIAVAGKQLYITSQGERVVRRIEMK